MNDDFLRILRDLTGLFLELDSTRKRRLIETLRRSIRIAMDTQPFPSDQGEKFLEQEVDAPCCDKKIRIELSCV